MKVFIVEDNGYTRFTIKAALEKMGHEVVGEAENFNEAMDKLKNSNADIVLLDIILPGLSGLDMLKEMDNKSKYKIIAITALEQDNLDKELIENGVKYILRKPFSYDELEKAIKNL